MSNSSPSPLGASTILNKSTESKRQGTRDKGKGKRDEFGSVVLIGKLVMGQGTRDKGQGGRDGG